MEFEKVEWVPQIEVLQNNGIFMVQANHAGLTKDDVKVELTDKMMLISGERKEEKEEKREGFYRSERSYGTFYRQILSGKRKAENTAATFRNGVLEITMPMLKAEPTIRKIEINEPPPARAVETPLHRRRNADRLRRNDAGQPVLLYSVQVAVEEGRALWIQY